MVTLSIPKLQWAGSEVAIDTQERTSFLTLVSSLMLDNRSLVDRALLVRCMHPRSSPCSASYKEHSAPLYENKIGWMQQNQ